MVVAATLAVSACTGPPASSSTAGGDGAAPTNALGVDLRAAGASTAASAIEQAPIVFPDGETVTLLAPDDSAFAAIDADSLASLLANPDQLNSLLANHTVIDAMTVEQMVDRGVVALPDGAQIAVTIGPDGPMIGDAAIVQGDIVVDDVTVHVINRMLVEVPDLRVKD